MELRALLYSSLEINQEPDKYIPLRDHQQQPKGPFGHVSTAKSSTSSWQVGEPDQNEQLQLDEVHKFWLNKTTKGGHLHNLLLGVYAIFGIHAMYNTAPTTAVAQKSPCIWDISARSLWSHSPFIPSSSVLPLETSENIWTRAKRRQDSGFASFKCSNPNQNMKRAKWQKSSISFATPSAPPSQATTRIIPFWRALNHIAIPRLWMVYRDLVCKELLRKTRFFPEEA